MTAYVVSVGGSISIVKARSRPDAINRVAKRFGWVNGRGVLRPELLERMTARKATPADIDRYEWLANATYPRQRHAIAELREEAS